MSNLISRQAAIDAINQICPIDTEYDCTLLDRVDVRCVLTELPSAQQWISVSERFPEPDERVLVYTVEHTYGVWDAMPHRADNYAWEDEAGLYHNKWEVDMWMTLPEPWKGEDDG